MKARALWTALGVSLLLALPFPAGAHQKTFASSTSIEYKAGTYFKGVVNSAQSSCKPDRTVQLFRDKKVDELVETTYTNRQGRWFLERPYENATFYAKLRPKKLRVNDHTHTCAGSKSPLMHYVIMSPTTMSGTGFSIGESQCSASPPDGAFGFVVGPSTPPLGFGSLKLDAGLTRAHGVFTTTLFDNQPLATIDELSYAAHITNASRILGMHLSVDPDGAGSEDTDVYSYLPPNPGSFSLNAWNVFTVEDSHTLTPHLGDGSVTTVGQLKASGATFSNDYPSYPTILAVDQPCEAPGSPSVNHLDRLVIRTGGVRHVFDFEPSP